MRLYHASTVAVEHPDLEHSRPNLDFGPGLTLSSLVTTRPNKQA